MNRRTWRGNRVGLLVLGLLLVAAGVYALLRRDEDGPLLSPSVREDFAAHDPWWWAVAAGCVLACLLALRWLLVQHRSPGVHRVRLEDDTRRGSAVLRAGALTDAVEAHAESCSGVVSARASLEGRPSRRSLRLDLVVDRGFDPARLRDELRGEVLRDVRLALEAPELPALVTLRAAKRAKAGSTLV